MPLNNEQLKHIRQSVKKAEESLRDASADIATAKRAGIDVADQEANARELRDRIRKMRAVYGSA